MPIQPGEDGFYHPQNEQELREIILEARDKNYELRVKGSGHSVPQAIYVDGFPYRQAEYYAPSDVANKYRRNFLPVPIPPRTFPVLLDNFNTVEFEQRDDAVYVRSGAGVHLGRDPYDPTERSTHFNSLFYQMEKQGVCVPDMGGITHQTVGGFLATGSAGGSTIHSLEPWINEIKFIDGTGTTHTCSRTNNKDMFDAVGVSMGLLGVVIEVTFKTTKRFDIKGTEERRPYQDYKGEIDFFGDGPNNLYDFFHSPKGEYARILWWPQKGTEKMTVWSAQTMQADDYNHQNSRIVDGERVLIPKPYQEVSWLFGSALLQEYLGDLFYTAVSYWPTWLYAKIKNSWLAMFIQQLVEKFWYGGILSWLLDVFVPTDKKDDAGNWEPQEFRDTWWRGLPMDNQMDDRLMGVVFTEIWVPSDHIAKVMRGLKAHYDKVGLFATGTFSAELYCTMKSDFWMSPAYGTEVFRVDLFLSATDLFDPAVYYEQFWELLKPYHMRTHWGKWQPGASDKEPKRTEWRDYMKKQYPKWDDFLAMRDKHDPDQVFVNEYWRERFGIKPLKPGQSHPPLEWHAAEPPHLKKEIDSTLVKPNMALLFGQKPLDKPSPLVYFVSVIYTFIFAAVPIWIMGNSVTGWCEFESLGIQIGITAVVGLLVGFGVVLFRLWGPLMMVILTAIGVIVANIIDIVTGGTLWVWTSMFGLSTFWTGVICELSVAVFVPIASWLTGSKLFSKYWPK